MPVPSHVRVKAQPARRSIPFARLLGALAFVVLVGLAACGGDPADDTPGGLAGATSSAAGEPGAEGAAEGDGNGGSAGEMGEPSEEGETAESGEGGAEGATFNLVASPDNVECSYVPNGHLNGSDLLNVHFYFLIIGGNPSDVPLVSVTGQSDTGLATSYNAGPHNQAVSTAQLALRSGDFGRSHAITLTVDAAAQVPETDESDNRIRVTVTLPSPRPSSVVDPLACSAGRA